MVTYIDSSAQPTLIVVKKSAAYCMLAKIHLIKTENFQLQARLENISHCRCDTPYILALVLKDQFIAIQSSVINLGI